MAEQSPDPIGGRGTAALVLIGGGVLVSVFGAYGLWGTDGAALVGGALSVLFGIALAWE
jgi:hypothetical protein